MKNRIITLAALAALISMPAVYGQEEGKAKGKNPMAMADKDGDGFVSKEEYMAIPQNKENAKAGDRFAALDKDGDGKLSKEEIQAGQKGKGKGKKEKSQ